MNSLLVLLHLRAREEKSRMPSTSANVKIERWYISLIKPGKALQVVNVHSAIGKACYESASLLHWSKIKLISAEKQLLLLTCSLSTEATSPSPLLRHTGKLTLDSTNPSDPLTINSPVLPLKTSIYMPSQSSGWSLLNTWGGLETPPSRLHPQTCCSSPS